MPLTAKQKHFIKNNYQKLSPEEVSLQLGAPKKEIERFIDKKFGRDRIQKSLNIPKDNNPFDFSFSKFVAENLNILIFLFLLAFLAYFNSLDNAFVSDDIPVIVTDPAIGKFSATFSDGLLVFPTKLLYFFIYNIAGAAPFIFRLLNLLFHMGNTFLVFVLVSSLYKKRTAIFAASLFAIHPLLTEPVVWISGGPYVRYTFFLLLSFFYYIFQKDYREKTKSLSFFLFALLFSEKAMAFPFILAAYETSRKTILESWKKLAPYAAIGFLWILLYAAKIGARIASIGEFQSQKSALANPLLQIPVALSSYLEMFFWPRWLTLYHTEMSFSFEQYIFKLIAVTFFLGAIVWAWKKNRPLFFWLAFFLIALLPTLTPFGVSWIVAERYSYFASIGLFVAIAFLLNNFLEKNPEKKTIVYSLFVIIILALSIRTIVRNTDWQNEDSLWIATAKVSPSGHVIHNNLGDVYSRQGNLEKSIEEFKKATEINPNYADAFHNLANTYGQAKNFDKAIANYQKALEINPALWQSHQQLSGIYFEQEKYTEAKDEMRKALEINPNNPNLQENLKIIETKLQ